MPSDEARARLTARQDELVRALVAGGASPAGMDDEALARARSLLEAKRRWLAARHARHEGLRPIEDTDPFRRLARRLMRAFAALIAS